MKSDDGENSNIETTLAKIGRNGKKWTEFNVIYGHTKLPNNSEHVESAMKRKNR